MAVRVTDIQGKVLADNARIEFIAPSVGDQTGTVDVRAIFDNNSQALLPGQVVRAHVEGVTLAGSLVIPKRAVMHGTQGSFVWVSAQTTRWRRRARWSSVRPRATTSSVTERPQGG